MPPLKHGEVADPFATRSADKDQERVPKGNPNSPVVTRDQVDASLDSEDMQRRRRLLFATTRLKDVEP